MASEHQQHWCEVMVRLGIATTLEEAITLGLLAHHEAGHAAVACALGVPLRLVRIDPLADEGSTDPAQEPTPLQDALILLAGGRAELAFDPTRRRRRKGAFLDEAKLLGVISKHFHHRLLHWRTEDYDAWMGYISDRLAARYATRMIAAHWTAIQRLAHRLAVQNEIEGPEAEAVLRG